MSTSPHPFDDLVITFKPDATAEEEERFLTDLARAILAVARHVIAVQEGDESGEKELETIEF